MIINKIDDIYQLFSDYDQDLFENIKNYYSNNKKITEICNSIMCIFNPEISNQNSFNNKAGKINLLEDLSSTNKEVKIGNLIVIKIILFL